MGKLAFHSGVCIVVVLRLLLVPHSESVRGKTCLVSASSFPSQSRESDPGRQCSRNHGGRLCEILAGGGLEKCLKGRSLVGRQKIAGPGGGWKSPTRKKSSYRVFSFCLPGHLPCFREKHTEVRRTQALEMGRLSWNSGCPLTSYMTLGKWVKLGISGVLSVKWSNNTRIF